MPDQHVMVEQVIYYRTTVEAETQEEAHRIVQELIDKDELEDIWELDNSPFEISTNP